MAPRQSRKKNTIARSSLINPNLNNEQVIGNNYRLLEPHEINVSFDDIWGYEECKKDLSLLIDYLNGAESFAKFGIIPPLKYIINGDIGSGKTTLACSVAKTANRPVIIIEPSFFFNTKMLDELEEIFSLILAQLVVGKHCILLFKNIEHIVQLAPEVSQPFIESLVRHFRSLPNLVAFATVEVSEEITLSQQLIGKPSFEKVIDLPTHELKVREQILTDLLRDVPTQKGLDIHRIALDVYSMSTGAIKHLIKEASLICLRNKHLELSYEHFSEAMAQMDFGYVSYSMSEEDRLATARHEAGHVVVGYFSDPINYKPSKVDITPRSVYMGVTQSTPDEQKKTFFKEEIESRIAMSLGGMAAEEFYYASTSSGCANDIQMATGEAINMVKLYGMSYDVGPICLLLENLKFPEIDIIADRAIQALLKSKYVDAYMIVKEHTKAIDALTQALLEKEVIYEEEIIEILQKNS